MEGKFAMNKETLLEQFYRSPIVAAVKNIQGLKQSLDCDVKVVFVLFGNVVDIPLIVEQIHQAGKIAIIHIDLIDGLAPREVSVDYIIKSTAADGIISTKNNIIRRARECGMLTIQRFFLIDSMAMHNIQKQLGVDSADFIEILPGVMPKQLKVISEKTNLPVIAGGLIQDKEDVLSALASGSVAVSSTNPEVWNL